MAWRLDPDRLAAHPIFRWLILREVAACEVRLRARSIPLRTGQIPEISGCTSLHWAAHNGLLREVGNLLHAGGSGGVIMQFPVLSRVGAKRLLLRYHLAMGFAGCLIC